MPIEIKDLALTSGKVVLELECHAKLPLCQKKLWQKWIVLPLFIYLWPEHHSGSHIHIAYLTLSAPPSSSCKLFLVLLTFMQWVGLGSKVINGIPTPAQIWRLGFFLCLISVLWSEKEFHDAAKRNDTWKMQELIKKGVDVNAKNKVSMLKHRLFWMSAVDAFKNQGLGSYLLL